MNGLRTAWQQLIRYKYLIISCFLVAFVFIFLEQSYRNTPYRDVFTPEVIVLLLTAIVLAWYSFETVELKIIQKKSLDILTTPLLNVFRNEDENVFYIKNVSSTFAKNIQFDSVSLFDGKVTYSIKAAKNYLSPSDPIIPIKTYRNDTEVGNNNFSMDLTAHLMEVKKIEIEVTCENIENTQHSFILVATYTNSNFELSMRY